MESVEETLSIDLETLTQHFISLNQAPDIIDCPNEHVVVNNVDQMLTDDYSCILNSPFDLKEVQCCVKKLKNGTSAGQDNLFPELFKYAPTDFYVILTNFFNDILEKGQIPDDWGLSIICPIYKKGQMSDPNIYRGISLFDCLAKIFTRKLSDRIQQFLDSKLIIGEEQAGFRPKHSCMDQVFALFNIINWYVTKGKKLFVTFVDYEKAFDRVNRMYLWQNLLASGVKGKILKVVQKLYQKTKACVRVNGTTSQYFDCMMGVRQGDTLSPLLFTIFLKDFKDFISNYTRGLSQIASSEKLCERESELFKSLFVLLYADDTVLLSETEDDMQLMIIATADYCKKFDMIINVGKTKYMIFLKGKIRKLSTLYLNQSKLERVDSFCYLGIIFKYNNTFQLSKQHNIDKARKALFKLDWTISKRQMPHALQLNLFDCLIKPILLYECETWGMENFETIEIFYRNFLRRRLKLGRHVPKPMVYGEFGKKRIEVYNMAENGKVLERSNKTGEQIV